LPSSATGRLVRAVFINPVARRNLSAKDNLALVAEGANQSDDPRSRIVAQNASVTEGGNALRAAGNSDPIATAPSIRLQHQSSHEMTVSLRSVRGLSTMKNRQLNLAEVKAKLSHLVDQAARSKSIVVAEAGLPVAKLAPLETIKRRR
jgi:prevent-host-death family protein